MTVSSTNLIQGPADVYTAPFGTAEPATIATVPTAPAGSAWVNVGGTREGVNLVHEKTFADLTVDQIVDVIESRVTGRSVRLNTTLAEPTLVNLAKAFADAAPASNVAEPDEGAAAFRPSYLALIIDGIAPGGFRRRITIRKALQTSSVETGYKKDGMTLLPVSFKAHWVSSAIRPFRIEDATA